MATKRISEISRSLLMDGTDLLILEKADGNTKSIEASNAKSYFDEHDHVTADITDLETVVDGLIDTEINSMKSTEQTITSIWNMSTLSYNRVDLGNVSGATALNLSTGMYFTLTLTGDVTFSISNPKSGAFINSFGLSITAGGAHTITWPANIVWQNNEEPTLSASSKDILTFLSDDNGVTWYNIGQVLAA